MISLDTLQRDEGLAHWEYVAALGVRQRMTMLRRWVQQKVTTFRGWVGQEVTALAKLAAPVVSRLVSNLSLPFQSHNVLSYIVQPKSW